MGKRKERRRLAAISNAGRRVKLDLCAEPSGELGGSNIHGDAGGESDSRRRDGLPNSPSSSGQQPQNPLLLLGQYSDDEGDEGSSKGPNDAKVESPMLDEEAKGSLGEESKDFDISVSEDIVSQNDGQLNIMENSTSLDAEGNEKNECDVSAGNLQKEMVSKDQMSASESFHEQVVTDINLGWKMVMHEESQRYYYWNIETGETSWEVPQGLAQETQLSNDLIPPASVDDKTVSAAVGIDDSSLPSAAIQDTSVVFTVDSCVETAVTSYKELHGHVFQVNGCSGEHTNEGQCYANGKELIRNNGTMTSSYGVDNPVSNFSVEEQQSPVDFPSHLVKQSESLLERLKSLKKSKGNSQGQDTLSKYQLEIEIRLSDIRSLTSYGSSLLPFWLHSDKKLKLIESAIDDDLYRTAISHAEVEDKHAPASKGLGDQQDGMAHDFEVDHNDNKEVVTSEVSSGSLADPSAVVLKDIHDEIHDEIPTTAQHVPLSSSHCSHMETVAEVNTQIEATASSDQSTLKNGYNVGEDVDMDVDMEVEDMNSSGNATDVDVSVAKGFAQKDQPVQVNPLADSHSLLPEDEFVVPPPPDDEWIPPPPPDNEHVPPPPPTDTEQVPPPPGDLQIPYHALPSYTEIGQPYSYAQYSISYPGAGSEYYGQTASEVPTSIIYGQIAMPPGQLYFSAVPHMYNENPQGVVNPADPIPYYELQDGAGSKSLPVNNFNDSSIGGEDRTSCDVPSSSSSIGEPVTVSVNDCVPLPPATVEAAVGSAVPSAVAAKVQNKVVRKKRTVAVGSSLKSNKKVSCLVDKWKAAKEELLEEEEEPESVYEVLERKRQREIEEWHAKQIASGEAKDNANFQPLGGDWRERVKRKRAKAAKQSVDTPQDSVEHSQQQPDLTELSKGLPSSWQAFWDDSSKQVYYGNTITSETTWTRPTK